MASWQRSQFGRMVWRLFSWHGTVAILVAASFGGRPLFAQQQKMSPTAVQQYVKQVIDKEIAAAANDHSRWMYEDDYRSPEKHVVKLVVQTADGNLSRTILRNGHALTPQEREKDESKMQAVINDPSVRAKQRRDSAHDDAQSASLLKILPDAFVWTETGESNGLMTFHFVPKASYQPPTYASRVFAAMAGEMVVNSRQQRLVSLSGKLIRPVEFGYGIFGKLQQGGTFHIIRSETGPGEWQITEMHVHIEGHVLFFKSISQQEDEITSHFRPTPANLQLGQAARQLNDGTIARELRVAMPQ